MLILLIVSNIFYHLPVIPFHCKKGIPYTHALRLNGTCSNNKIFDKKCNYLKKYLCNRGYTQKNKNKKTFNATFITFSIMYFLMLERFIRNAFGSSKGRQIQKSISWHSIDQFQKSLGMVIIIIYRRKRHVKALWRKNTSFSFV